MTPSFLSEVDEMGREYVCVYHSYLESIEALDDAERGRLFTAILEYSSRGETGAVSGNERFVWPFIRSQIDRDEQQYEERCRKNSENGKRGGRPKTEENREVISETQNNRTVFPETQKSQEKEKEEGEDKDKGEDEEEYTPPTPQRGERARAREREADFEQLWAAYPRKVGKEAARKAFAKLKSVDVQTLIAAIEAQKQSRQWQDTQFVPHLSTWLNQGRWTDEITPMTTQTSAKSPAIGKTSAEAPGELELAMLRKLWEG